MARELSDQQKWEDEVCWVFCLFSYRFEKGLAISEKLGSCKVCENSWLYRSCRESLQWELILYHTLENPLEREICPHAIIQGQWCFFDTSTRRLQLWSQLLLALRFQNNFRFPVLQYLIAPEFFPPTISPYMTSEKSFCWSVFWRILFYFSG